MTYSLVVAKIDISGAPSYILRINWIHTGEPEEKGVGEMATQVQGQGDKSDKNFFIFVDGEKFAPSDDTMAPNQIISDATELDPATHYLLRTNRGQESFKDKGDVPIQLQKADRFQVVSVGPTPVS